MAPWMHFIAVLPLLQLWRQHFRFIPQSVSKLQSDWHFPLTVGVGLGHTPEFTASCPWTSELKSKHFDSQKKNILSSHFNKLIYVVDNKRQSSVCLMAGFILLQALHSFVYYIQHRLFYFFFFLLFLFYLILFTGLFFSRVIFWFSCKWLCPLLDSPRNSCI